MRVLHRVLSVSGLLFILALTGCVYGYGYPSSGYSYYGGGPVVSDGYWGSPAYYGGWGGWGGSYYRGGYYPRSYHGGYNDGYRRGGYRGDYRGGSRGGSGYHGRAPNHGGVSNHGGAPSHGGAPNHGGAPHQGGSPNISVFGAPLR